MCYCLQSHVDSSYLENSRRRMAAASKPAGKRGTQIMEDTTEVIRLGMGTNQPLYTFQKEKKVCESVQFLSDSILVTLVVYHGWHTAQYICALCDLYEKTCATAPMLSMGGLYASLANTTCRDLGKIYQTPVGKMT